MQPPPPPGSRGRRASKSSTTFHVSVFNTTAFPSGRDWAELPRDAISYIFRTLDQAELLLGGPVASCRSWRRAARDDPSLWRRMDLRHLPCYASPRVNIRNTMRDAVRLSAGQCDTFFGNFLVDDDLLLFLAEQAPLLKSLHLNRCYVSKHVFAKAIKSFPLLEELELSMCLDYGGVLELVAEECKNLKHFRLVAPRRCFDDSDEPADDHKAFAIAKMHGLRSLHLDGDRLGKKGLAAILDNCPHLEYLNICHCTKIKMDDDLQAKCSQVKLDNRSYDIYHFSCHYHIVTPRTYQDYDYPDYDDYYDASYDFDDNMDDNHLEDHERILDIKRMRRYLP